jgi:hypothetical protein
MMDHFVEGFPMLRYFQILSILALLGAAVDLSTARAAEPGKTASPAAEKQSGTASQDNVPPEGFVALFNGRDILGWKGLVGTPVTRAKMTPDELVEAQRVADEKMRAHWSARDGVLVFDGKGDSLCTARDYGDFEMLVDWKIEEQGDSGVYLRGSPQVQIWDTKAAARNGVGSGGLFNNQKPENPAIPSKVADKPVGEWNSFRIKMVGEKVSIHLNGELVVDNVTLENYWERDKPIYSTGQIELQNHGNTLYFKNIYLREIPRELKSGESEKAAK